MTFLEYAWLVPIIPLAAFIIVGLFGNRTPEGGGYIAIAGAAAAFVLSLLVGYEFFTGSGDPFIMETAWLKLNDEITLNFGIYIDNLSVLMMLFASFISTLIFIYSVGYMSKEDEKKQRYYAEVSLFLTAMLGLVMASNFLEMFIFWEIVGLCSYLLIGFWSFKHPEGDDAQDDAASAAKKAFLVTRMGDVCLMGGLFVFLFAFKSLDYQVLFNAAKIATVNPDMIALGSILVFGGVIGKSAQFPLHDWLPDAMAGPTTVSALIHAATMVKAGVYLVARSYPLFVQSADVMLVVAIVGGFTAIFAASMALNNMNLKRVLAYSTLSQLGYMVLALGAGGYVMAIGLQSGDVFATEGYTAGVFHMMNHAFFKALLFLGAGSVIFAVGSEDMRQMGGLGKKMRVTSVTMLIGALSIAGIPLFAGFWSKDLVLAAVIDANAAGGGGVFILLFIMGVVTALMTAFYMFRLWYMTFRGEEGEASKRCAGESPRTMTSPLMVLAALALFSGFFILVGFNDLLTFSFVGGSFVVGGHGTGAIDLLVHLAESPYTYLSIVVAVLGIYLAYRMYKVKDVDPGRFNADGESKPYKLLQKRYYFPQFYNAIAMKFAHPLAMAVNYFDREAVDGTVNGIAGTIVNGSEGLRKTQDGQVHTYATVVVGGVVLLAALLFIAVYLSGGL